MASRLGALSILKRIAITSPGDHIDILEIISAFLRQHIAKDRQGKKNKIGTNEGPNLCKSRGFESKILNQPDLRKALDILGSREMHQVRSRNSLNNRESISSINIDGSNISGIEIRNLNFDCMKFLNINFCRSSIIDCSFKNATIEDSAFYQTIFLKMGIKSFEGANFINVDLSNARGLSLEILKGSGGDANSRIPHYINILGLDEGWNKSALISNYFFYLYGKYFALKNMNRSAISDEEIQNIQYLACNTQLDTELLVSEYKRYFGSSTETPPPRSS